MTTLIAAYNSDGCVGRCDCRCYHALGPECRCLCRGANHGVGRQEAIQNTRELAETWLEQARADGQDLTRAEVTIGAFHQSLFDLGGVR